MYAEESITTETQTPALTDQTVSADPEPEQESDAVEKATTEDNSQTQDVDQKLLIDDSATEATPQPPAIDTQAQPIYEPESIDNNLGVKNDLVIEQPVTATPQPPLIDLQPQPSYEPKTLASEPAIQASESAPQPPAEDKHIKPGDPSDLEPESTDPVTQIIVDTETEQEIDKTEITGVKTEQKQKTTKWTETYPISVNADWLQLKSGEWLRGRITVMQKDSLEFDSDELNDLVIKWKNVKYLKSYEPYSLRFDSLGRVSITGVIEVRGDKVNVKTDYDEKTYERSDLLTIASGKETEISLWKSKVTFSVNVRRGNTDQTDFASKMTAKRRTTDSRLILDYLGNFTQVQETETINNHRLNETFDIFLSRNLFWTPVFSEFFRDPFQNIERRINIGVGIGYSLINTNETEWNITGGPSYQETRFVSVQAGTDPADKTLTLALGTNFDTELNSIVDLEGLYSVSLGDNETGNYTHHALLTIETELTDKLDFDVTAVWDYVRSPVADENNNTPESNDFRIMIGLGYDL